jgi:hypothetical protein
MLAFFVVSMVFCPCPCVCVCVCVCVRACVCVRCLICVQNIAYLFSVAYCVDMFIVSHVGSSSGMAWYGMEWYGMHFLGILSNLVDTCHCYCVYSLFYLLLL